MHRRDDRLRAATYRFDEVARQARETQEALHVHLRERADDLVYVASGTEVVSGAGDDHRVHVFRVYEVAERIANLDIGVERQRVFALRMIEREGRHGAVYTPKKMCWFEL